MNYRLLPRFYYAFPLYKYFLSFFKRNSGNTKLFLEEYGKANGFFCNYARSGLKILLRSIGSSKLNIGVQVFTCNTVFSAIKASGHEIVFIDINDRFGLDTDDLRKKKDEIDLLIITHTFGIPDDYDRIKEIIGDKIIIEDCSHSFMSKHKNSFTGTLGDASIFSFGFGKLPPIGQGGLIVINNPDHFPLFDKTYSAIYQETIISEILHLIKILVFSILLRAPFYGLISYKFGKKIDSQIDILKKGSVKESKGYLFDTKFFLNSNALFYDLIKTNVENHKRISAELKESIIKPFVPAGSFSNCYIYPIMVDNRDDLIKILLKNNIEAGKHFSNSVNWALQEGYNTNTCPNAERIVEKIMTIPAHKGVSSQSIAYISELINRYAT